MANEDYEDTSIAFARHAIFLENKKQLIKKDIIRQTLLKDHRGSFDVLVDETNRKLKETFGFELVKADKKKNSFILINRESAEYAEVVQETYKDAKNLYPFLPKVGLISFILAFVALNDNKLSQGELNKSLEDALDINISQDTEFGQKIPEVLTDLIKQNYLDRMKIKDGAIDDQTYYSWGARAYVEYPIDKLAHFIAMVYGSENIEEIQEHLHSALQKQ
ncbi:MAGE protein domain-containing protein [Rozella allomycis CSF55]|uniref:MAGE protein domain-containing protein n=1 Tax=Rozella allomycis (strain CSF55) TaxID=988480 RepID=A0A075APL7_ROZAC|nr:MAGE protein domain-containing protein [Rozella allomycis CSF55]|eukprot:EPZ32033.1 MAGE protein domain-containing protein [Rozella allomycis CSF55]